jgi:hypothetical protein
LFPGSIFQERKLLKSITHPFVLRMRSDPVPKGLSCGLDLWEGRGIQDLLRQNLSGDSQIDVHSGLLVSTAFAAENARMNGARGNFVR